MIQDPAQASSSTATRSRGGYDRMWFDVLSEVEERHFWFRARNRIIAQVVQQLVPKLGPRVRLLEVGCGNGNVLRVLKPLCPEGQVVGMDLFHEGLNHARRRCDCVLVSGDIMDAPFPEGSFDLIGMFDVLEHLPDDRGALGALHRLLAPGGAVVLTVPASPALWSYFDEVGGHYRRYERVDLISKLVQSGFEVSCCTHFMTTIFPLVWAARQWGGRGFRRTAASTKPSDAQTSPAESKDPFQQALAELKVRPGVNEVLLRLLRWESWWLARRWPLPFGTSLLIVARKPAASN